jgi:hypothetical protein
LPQAFAPAPQSRHDRADRDAQDPCRLFLRQIFNTHEKQDGSLFFRQRGESSL